MKRPNRHEIEQEYDVLLDAAYVAARQVVGNHHDAEDVAHTVLAEFVERWSDLRKDTPELRRAFAIGRASWRAKDLLRQRDRQPVSGVQYPPESPQPDDPPETQRSYRRQVRRHTAMQRLAVSDAPMAPVLDEEAEMIAQYNELHSALQSLGRRQRDLIARRYFQGLTEEEVARELDMGFFATRKALYRIRKQLQEMLQARITHEAGDRDDN